MKTNPNDLTSTLTKREWLTGMALQGLLAAPDLTVDARTNTGDFAVLYADRAIESLNKTNPAGTAGDTHV